MKVAHVHRHVDKQRSLQQDIESSVPNAFQNNRKDLNHHELKTCLDMLKDKWKKFTINHDAIMIAIDELTSSDQEDIFKRSYFRYNVYSTTQTMYINSLEQISQQLATITTQDLRSVSISSVSDYETSQGGWHQCSKLQRLDIPKFDGALAEWLHFKSMFTSMVVNTPLPCIVKLQYLKLSLIGSAQHLIKHSDLVPDNFQKTWEMVISFYENERMILNTALQTLLSMKPMNRESATELENLYTNMLQLIRTLEALKRPVEHWDDWFVFLTVQRLDSETVKLWEQHLGSSKSPPPWEQLSQFLLSRMLSLKGFEKSRTNRPLLQSSIRPIKSHYSGQESRQCPLCSSLHYLAKCSQYNRKSIQQRLETIQIHRLCFNCLGKHQLAQCESTKRCLKCDKKHHTSIHKIELQSNEDIPLQQDQFVSNTSVQQSSRGTVLLATVQLRIRSVSGEYILARALLDQGSEVSLICETLVHQLRLQRQSSNIPLIGIGARQGTVTRGVVTLHLKPHFESSITVVTKAHVLRKVTAKIPSTSADPSKWSHLDKLTLADPGYYLPGTIDILLGAEAYADVIEQKLIKGPIDTPIAQLTKFGWIISGAIGESANHAHRQWYSNTIDRDLYTLLEQFWKQEELQSHSNSSMTPDEEECENHYLSTHTRDHNGQYVVRLPLKQTTEHLGDSKVTARRILSGLARKFVINPGFHELYRQFLNDYQSLSHMQLVRSTEPEPKRVFYLPHHGVIKEDSLTTKLRVVFNGSKVTTSGVSLNDILHTGKKLQKDLIDVLLWFRQHKYVFSADIEKMYRQIKVNAQDWDLQRILWIDSSKHIVTYQLTTVTYGLACAPFLAIRSILQLLKDEGQNFPLAKEVLDKGRYVDDIFGGSSSIQHAQEVVRQVNKLCMAGGFMLHKWVSNDPAILTTLPVEKLGNAVERKIQDQTFIKTLGLSWNPHTDTIQFKHKPLQPKNVTKRIVLSRIAQLFDPLGLIAPVVVKAKIFLQELWLIKLNWDDPLPSNVIEKWLKFEDNLNQLSCISIPRWLSINKNSALEIHGFSDASQEAMAAVVYVRVNSTEDTPTTVRLIASKTKVAPLKRMTIPRLELSAAALLVKLTDQIIRVLEFHQVPIYLWTDSSTTFTWITSHPSKWKEFVHNRVCFIQETLPSACWKFVPGKSNPADCASRGLTPSQLVSHVLWWSGPNWLSQPPQFWPSITEPPTNNATSETRPVQVTVATQASSDQINLIHRYSSFMKLIRVTALCQRAISRFKHSALPIDQQPLTPEELDSASKFWIRCTQQSCFSKEIHIITAGNSLPKSNPLVRLTPFIDGHGLLRVGGRLHNAPLVYDNKHPMILPRRHHLSTLLISAAHLRTLHGGTQVTLQELRTLYWIIGGRAPVRSFILKCVKCARYRQTRAQQLMGQLPVVSTRPSRPFLHSGVDYAGPITMKTWKGRTARPYKGYIALFVCLATSAIHLELVTDYTSETFIASYKRFTARRGICATLRSDCGTTLVGADAELKRLFTSSSKELKTIATLLANDGTKWIFNPPAAPHFGGRWEAGVKSVKHHLKRIIGHCLLTYEEMTTALAQVEAVLNSRPLCPLSDDADDLSALTPGHFLIGDNITAIPEPSLLSVNSTRLSRWQVVRQILDQFWSQWSKGCLQRYQAIYKWANTSANIKIGALVLVIDERYPPSKWPLGRITSVHPGTDGLIRVVTIRTQVALLKRPISKICPLPVEADIC